jgi:hypothetical protein
MEQFSQTGRHGDGIDMSGHKKTREDCCGAIFSAEVVSGYPRENANLKQHGGMEVNDEVTSRHENR